MKESIKQVIGDSIYEERRMLASPDDFGEKNKDWIQYDMHMCFNELLYAASTPEHELFYEDDDTYHDFQINTMGWLKFKLPRIETVVVEINFFTAPVLAGHLHDLQIEYPNIKNVVITWPSKTWMSARWHSYERIEKLLNSLQNKQYNFTIYNLELVEQIKEWSENEEMSGTDALRLLDHSMNFYWREENMHEDDYFNPEGPAWGYWYKRIIQSCPCVTESYLKDRIKDNIKLRNQIL